jgi:hypothetical protein
MSDDETRDEAAEPSQGETTKGSLQGDNPTVEEVEGTGGEGEDQGGLGDRTGGAGGAVADEVDEAPTDAAEHRK